MSLRSSQKVLTFKGMERQPSHKQSIAETNTITPVVAQQTLTTDYRDDEVADEIIDEEDIIAEEREPSFHQTSELVEMPYEHRMSEQP